MGYTSHEGLQKVPCVINFLNRIQNDQTPIQQHFVESQAHLEKAKVLVRNLESKKWHGPFPLITWG